MMEGEVEEGWKLSSIVEVAIVEDLDIDDDNIVGSLGDGTCGTSFHCEDDKCRVKTERSKDAP